MPSFCETLKYAFVQSDRIGQAILIILGVFSAWAWMIILNRGLELWLMSGKVKRFKKAYEQVKSPIGIGQRLSEHSGPLKEVCAAGIATLLEVCQIPPERQALFFRQCQLPRQLNDNEIERIRCVMNAVEDKQIKELESELGILGTLVSISPFLGLFGTVWGVMLTFIAISLHGRPDLSAIAPGISGALLTTVAGLVVAIPALVANNACTSTVQRICLDMDILIDDFMVSLKLETTAPPTRPVSEAFMAPVTGAGDE